MAEGIYDKLKETGEFYYSVKAGKIYLWSFIPSDKWSKEL